MVSPQDISKLIEIIKNISRYDFNDYSEKSFQRRVEKILIDNRLNLTGLIEKLKSNNDFLERVVKDITVNTTELFRDPEIWVTLRHRILPRYKNNKSIFIWHSGCSSGQEVYSMLILLNEMGMLDQAKIFATDINTDMLEMARKGVFRYRFNLGYFDNFDKVLKENPYNIDEGYDISYSKYLDIDKAKDSITMKPFLRDKPVYRKHDLVNDKNIFYSKFDIIFCRNVIIYFNNNLQNKVIELFSNNLYKDGYLVLGAHESILGPVANNFERTKGVYKKKSF